MVRVTAGHQTNNPTLTSSWETKTSVPPQCLRGQPFPPHGRAAGSPQNTFGPLPGGGPIGSPPPPTWPLAGSCWITRAGMQDAAVTAGCPSTSTRSFHGFGLVTAAPLPGKQQRAEEMLYGGKRENCGTSSHKEKAVFRTRGVLQVWLESRTGWKFVGEGSKQGNKLSFQGLWQKRKKKALWYGRVWDVLEKKR